MHVIIWFMLVPKMLIKYTYWVDYIFSHWESVILRYLFWEQSIISKFPYRSVYKQKKLILFEVITYVKFYIMQFVSFYEKTQKWEIPNVFDVALTQPATFNNCQFKAHKRNPISNYGALSRTSLFDCLIKIVPVTKSTYRKQCGVIFTPCCYIFTVNSNATH